MPLDQIHLDLLHPLRRLGFFGGLKAIERATGILRSEETSGLSREGGGISSRSAESMPSSGVLPWNRRMPVRHSCSTTPSENTSLRASSVSPRICSGLM